MTKLKLEPRKRKYIFIVDQLGHSLVEEMIQQVKEDTLDFEIHLIKDNDEGYKQLTHRLELQKMGTYLYIAMDWILLYKTIKIAKEIGFSEDEMQFIGHGGEMIQVFCCRCHGINFTERQERITCQHCSLDLTITEHYSPLQDAYLGFLTKL